MYTTDSSIGRPRRRASTRSSIEFWGASYCSRSPRNPCATPSVCPHASACASGVPLVCSAARRSSVPRASRLAIAAAASISRNSAAMASPSTSRVASGSTASSANRGILDTLALCPHAASRETGCRRVPRARSAPVRSKRPAVATSASHIPRLSGHVGTQRPSRRLPPRMNNYGRSTTRSPRGPLGVLPASTAARPYCFGPPRHNVTRPGTVLDAGSTD